MMWQGHGEHHIWCLWAVKMLLWTFIDLIQRWYGVQITSIRDIKTSDKSCELMSFHDTGHNFGSPGPPLRICLPQINSAFNCTVFFRRLVLRYQNFKARSHGAMSDCDLLYQEMECCLRFSDFVHTVRWVWMQFAMYLHWNRTLQSHGMGVEPNHVWHRTHQCITRTWNCTIWTPSLTSTQSIFCIAVANK